MPTILVCDDSSFMRGRIKALIAPLNADIIEAVDGKDCLNKLENKSVDVILLDLLMPVLTGTQVLMHLKNRKISTPVIVLSADVQSSTKEECLALGARAFLNKPPQQESLLQEISTLLTI